MTHAYTCDVSRIGIWGVPSPRVSVPALVLTQVMHCANVQMFQGFRLQPVESHNLIAAAAQSDAAGADFT